MYRILLNSKMTASTLQLVALMLALGVLGILVADTIIAIQQAEAQQGCLRGFPQSAPAINASKGRCL
jgi:hypothetical protein